ncbi:MAG: hypothetical protein JXM70_14525, partial [Pirellulales bacterium]|nr:hypothetical protein [Pirellulales bacterium]
MKLNKTLIILIFAGLVLVSTVSTYAQEDWWGPYAPSSVDPDLPNVLIIGDSISGGAQGYLYDVRNNLSQRANVFQCNITRRTSYALDEWPNVLNNYTDWDVIHFNWGLHDLEFESGAYHVPIADYTNNLDGVGNIIDRFESIVNSHGENPVLLWASTTPVPYGISVPQGTEGRSNDDVIAYNAAAATIMNSRGIPITDLYTAVATHSHPELLYNDYPNNVHFSSTGSTFLGGLVTAAIDPYVPAAPIPQDNEVVGLWTFNEKAVGQVGNDGDPVLDTSVSSNVHNGTIRTDVGDDVPYVAGQPDFQNAVALQFERGTGGGLTEGNNDRVEVPGHIDFQFDHTQSFTIETMIRTTQVTGGPVGSDTEGTAPLVGGLGSFWIDDDQPGKMMFAPGFGAKIDSEFGGVDTRAKTWSTTDVNDDQWHHIAGVYDGTSELVQLYIDGTEEGSVDVSAWTGGTSWSGIVGPGAGGTLLFGSSGQGYATREFEGDMDFVRVTRGALAPGDFLIPEPPPEVVGLWTFNEKAVGQVGNNGDTVLDSSGSSNVHNGTIMTDPGDDVPYVDGKPDLADGPALQFERGTGGDLLEGNNDRVEVPGGADFQFDHNQSFTIETMIRTSQVTGGPSGSDTEGTAPLVGGLGSFWIDDDKPGKMMFAPGFGAKNDTEFGDVDTRGKTWSNTAVNDDEWHHIAGVYDGTSESVRLFIDGIEEDSVDVSAWTGGTSWSGTVGPGESESLVFGSTGQGYAIREFEGDMDFVRITRGALRPADFNLPEVAEGVVGLWTFNEKAVGQFGNNGDPVLDTSGSSNVHNGTIMTDPGDDVPYVEGKPGLLDGPALQFERGTGGDLLEGNNDRVEVTGGADFRFHHGQSFTIETMIRTTQETGGPSGSDTEGAAPLVSGLGNLWIDDDQPGKVMFTPGFGLKEDSEFGGIDTRAKTWSTTDVNDDEWHHIAGVYDGINEMVRLYIDGVEEDYVDVSAWTGGLSWGNLIGPGASESLFFGTTGQGYAIREFEGDMDFVRITRGALIPDQFYGLNIPGDFNGDGSVDVSDLGILAGNYGATSG